MKIADHLQPLAVPIAEHHHDPATPPQLEDGRLAEGNAFELADDAFPQGPTHGYHVNAWGFVFELLLERSAPIQLGEDGRLQHADAKYFAKRSVWPPRMMHSAFGHMVRRCYVRIHHVDGRAIASVDLEQLIEDLRRERHFERQDPDLTSRYEALRYFRSRRFSVHLPWLDEVLRAVDRDDREVVRRRPSHSGAGA